MTTARQSHAHLVANGGARLCESDGTYLGQEAIPVITATADRVAARARPAAAAQRGGRHVVE